MTERTWTPGPWAVSNDENRTIIAPDKMPVAYYVDSGDDALIAAAPDLYEALENLIDAINAYDKLGERSLTITGSTANLKWLTETLDDAHTILAKARGEK